MIQEKKKADDKNCVQIRQKKKERRKGKQLVVNNEIESLPNKNRKEKESTQVKKEGELKRKERYKTNNCPERKFFFIFQILK